MNKQTFYLVWGPGVPNVKHADYDEAKREAERLAHCYHNREFVVVKAVSGHTYKPYPMLQVNYGKVREE